MTPLSRNEALVESWNSYRCAPLTGFQANAGVRVNDRLAGSSTRSRNGFSPVGAALVRASAAVEPTSAGDGEADDEDLDEAEVIGAPSGASWAWTWLGLVT